ncbi:hypothetical protein EZV62_008397 [Acer yangbiense]|uniref:Uncharacterized protein n=1 Tax=Acer yangbiense TaxID=1000413 RepID=A0A5C7IDZ3_9ROSI|nr:hypothetical protein EZV62_008397 [Acer yangbiense]
MPKSFWAEAVLCGVYLLNRCPTKSLDTKTSQEAWSSHKPSVSHLRVFGSIAYIKVPEARRTKLEDKGEKCILVGYGDRTMGYRLYNPVTKKVIFSRDVIFEENESWNWDQTKASRSAEWMPEEETREMATEPQIPRDQQTPQRTGLGAALVNLDKGTQSWVLHCKSDVLALQLHPSMGNVVLCGLRNGAIVTADIRERPEAVSNRLITHQMPYSPSRRIGQNSKKHWFKRLTVKCVGEEGDRADSEEEPELTQSDLYENLSLVEEDGAVLEISEEETVDGAKDVDCCLVGKVLSGKKVNREAFRSLIEQIWSPFGQVEVELVADNTFMFYFIKQEDRNRVWQRGPWHFEKSLIMLEKPKRTGNYSQLDFNKADLGPNT